MYKLNEEMKEKYQMFNSTEHQKVISEFSDGINAQFENLILEYVSFKDTTFNPVEYNLNEYPHENKREVYHLGTLIFWTQIVYGDGKATFNIHRCF